jgi:hypothetical protein
MQYWMFSLTIRLFDYFYSFPIHTVSNKRACNRIDQILNQAIRWLLLRIYSIAISSHNGFKTEGEESETDDDYGFLNLTSPLEIK